MTWVDPGPEKHDDSEEILPGWTWGDHRMMEAALKELEESDPRVKAAREQLDAKLIEAGLMAPPAPPVEVCSECGQPVFKPHDYDCPDRPALPGEIPERDAGGYQYINDKFEVVHTTSVPMNDEEAFDYFRNVEQMNFNHETHVRYLTKRGLRDNDYKMLPFQYDSETKEVTPIAIPGSGS